ncbi:bleomycin resistance protein [Actinomycetospora sp. CA-101289]|uniref:bleomycin resistance protein n=1 Tax=Actinomycetospora sp. CA-101289 TaxID=3239893 RepID=UPI003D97D134
MTQRLVAIPILPVRDMPEALEFWSRLPHLTVEQYEGGGYAFVRHLDAEVIHLDHRPGMETSANMAGCYLHVPGIDALHEALASAGMPVSDVRDEPWGMREFTLTDPSGNVLRLGCGD